MLAMKIAKRIRICKETDELKHLIRPEEDRLVRLTWKRAFQDAIGNVNSKGTIHMLETAREIQESLDLKILKIWTI